MPVPTALEDYRLFPGINESWELIKTGMIVISSRMYKLELWRSHSNADIPFYVSIYVDREGMWKRMADPPFPIALSGEEALRTAMAFLSEREAA